MFSEALRILNHNTAVLMVDEYRKKYQEMETKDTRQPEGTIRQPEGAVRQSEGTV